MWLMVFLRSHTTAALVGLAVIFATITLVARPDLDAGEIAVTSWLKSRQPEAVETIQELGAVETRYRR